MADTETVYRLKVTVDDVKPEIWREVDVPASASLSELHNVLQILMGWDDYHLWAFEAGRRRFEPPDPDVKAPRSTGEDPERTKLSDVLRRKGDALRYNYDFGDDWWLRIVVNAVTPREPGARYPRCVAGERAGPPEDCGGPPALEDLLAAHKRPKSKRAKELLEWTGPDWDPEAFDLPVINKALLALPAPRKLH